MEARRATEVWTGNMSIRTTEHEFRAGLCKNAKHSRATWDPGAEGEQ